MNYVYKRILSNGREAFMVKEEASNRFVVLVNSEAVAKNVVDLLNEDAKEAENEH